MVKTLQSRHTRHARVKEGPVTYIHIPPSVVLAVVLPQQDNVELIYTHTADYAHAVSQLQHVKSLRHQVIHDPLTQIFNRLGFERHLRKVPRLPCTSTLALADVDNLKQENDIHGHARGDKVLSTVATFLQCIAAASFYPRKVIAGRCGGDEFCLLFIGWSGEEAKRVLQEKMQLLRRCTISVGIASFPQQADTIEELRRKADKAMYVAKRSGKGRCIVYHDSMDNSE